VIDMSVIMWIIVALLVVAALTFYVIKTEREAAARRIALAPRVRNYGLAYYDQLSNHVGQITAETLREAIDLQERTGGDTTILQHMLDNLPHIGHVTRSELITPRPIPGRGFPVGPILIRDYAINRNDLRTWPSRSRENKK
jgi:hypothetical protein